MKFLTKINRNYSILLTILLVVVSISAYFILHSILLDDIKGNLIEKEVLIKDQINKTGEIPNIYPIVEVRKENQKANQSPLFKEIIIYDKLENEEELFLEYSDQIKIKNAYYSIKLRQSAFESEDLVFILAGAFSILLLSSFGILFLINKKMNKTVWIDFEHNLHEIESFNFTENNNLRLVETDIEEFDRLNKVINNLTTKLKTDFQSLKEFSENASHEIQTPLSIVLLNLEEMLQQDLSEDTFSKVITSMNALKRLSTLNQSLILLTKIENRQFSAVKTIRLNELVKRKIEEFTVLFEAKKIGVELHNEQDFEIKMNDHLAELLINNLLSNSINHNIMSGSIILTIRSNELKISNTGEPNSLTDETIFNRFTKCNSKSYGLGLAIVKNICETNNLEIHYSKNGLHCFTINSKI